jgi:hypothetical protein
VHLENERPYFIEIQQDVNNFLTSTFWFRILSPCHSVGGRLEAFDNLEYAKQLTASGDPESRPAIN